MARVRWGVLSTANIGIEKVIPAIQRASNCTVVAIASRSDEAARAAALDLGIPRAYGSYQAMLDLAEIDAVYIPLPNDLHAEWTCRAAAAGKHILCEKPLAMTADQAIAMVAACDEAGVLLQEAFMYRHHPTWVEAIRLVRSGAIGEVRAVQSWFSYFNDDPTSIRNRLENGGGAVMDIGCYCINVARLVFDEEPTTVQSVVNRDASMGVDVLSSALLGFSNGRRADFTCSIRAERDQRVHIVGTTGRIDFEIPFNIPPDAETRISVTWGGDGRVTPDTETISFPPSNQYTAQAETFAAAILAGESVPVHPDDAVANMRVIERVLAGIEI
jgi:predicted dehydrogenase